MILESVVCIGAGPAGLTAAYELSKHGQKPCVLEVDNQYVGGIARTIRQHHDGREFCFDVGGHRFFSKSSEIIALWQEILGLDLLIRSRKSRIFFDGTFYPYPLDLWYTLKKLGPVESLRCVFSYLYAHLFPAPRLETFEEWVTKCFGARIFLIFFKTYTEKVWGMKCSEISADWAAQRIKGLSLKEMIKNAAYSVLGITPKGNRIKTLIEEFFYPRKGPGMMWEVAAAKIEAMNGRIEMGRRVEKLSYDPSAQQWNIICRDAVNTRFDMQARHIISSMPLRELVHAIDGAPQAVLDAADGLRYRDFLIVALILRDRAAFDDNWLYIHSPEVKVGRIQNFKAWSADMVSDPSLVCYGMEYFCFEGDGLWASSDDELIRLGVGELAIIGLGAREDIVGGYVVRQRKAYPVYDHYYQARVDVIRHWLSAHCPNLQTVGRNGMHKYNNQDHSMMTALLAAKNILAGHVCYDVWRVNQDAEYCENTVSGASGERLVPSTLSRL